MHWIYAHLIGDYIIQNDWMAQHKKDSSFRCDVHDTVPVVRHGVVATGVDRRAALCAGQNTFRGVVHAGEGEFRLLDRGLLSVVADRG